MSIIRRSQRGALMIEVLVSMVLCAFGLLGFMALQARATGSELESFQRSQALVLLDDMVARLNANRADASSYVSAGLVGGGDVESCAGLAGSALDLCEWANLLRGVAEVRNGNRIGAMFDARGCITRAPDTSDRYLVAVAWQGIVASGGSPVTCGQGEATFPTEGRRRAVAATVCIARLRDPAIPSVMARC